MRSFSSEHPTQGFRFPLNHYLKACSALSPFCNCIWRFVHAQMRISNAIASCQYTLLKLEVITQCFLLCSLLCVHLFNTESMSKVMCHLVRTCRAILNLGSSGGLQCALAQIGPCAYPSAHPGEEDDGEESTDWPQESSASLGKARIHPFTKTTLYFDMAWSNSSL